MQSRTNIIGLYDKYWGYSWPQLLSERPFSGSQKSGNMAKLRVPKWQTKIFLNPPCVWEGFGPGNKCSLTTDNSTIVFFSTTNSATVDLKHYLRKLLSCLHTTMKMCKHISRGRHSEIAQMETGKKKIHLFLKLMLVGNLLL